MSPARAVVLAVFLFAAPVAAQSADSIMELNRSGRWAEAAGFARARLQAWHERTSDLPLTEACALAYHLAYADTRLGRLHDAEYAVEAVDDFACGAELADSWVPREMDRLRDELGMGPPDGTARGPAERQRRRRRQMVPAPPPARPSP